MKSLLLAFGATLCACGSSIHTYKPVPKVPAIPMTDREYWRCGARVPGGEFIEVYFQGIAPGTKPRVVLWEGDAPGTTVYLDCNLILLGDGEAH